jgi:hypothetical protein
MRYTIIAALVLMPVPAAANAASEQPADGDKVVCKSVMKTGTRFRTRTCHTRKQWQEIEEQNKRNTREMIDRPVIEARRG